MAPEILEDKGHSFQVDWWALGILTYEMIVGFTPYHTGARHHKNDNKLLQHIKTRDLKFPDPQRHEITISKECQNFIQQLLTVDPNQRLGSSGNLKEVLDHPWLKDLDHKQFERKEIEPPYMPTVSSENPLDLTNFDKHIEV